MTLHAREAHPFISSCALPYPLLLCHLPHPLPLSQPDLPTFSSPPRLDLLSPTTKRKATRYCAPSDHCVRWCRCCCKMADIPTALAVLRAGRRCERRPRREAVLLQRSETLLQQRGNAVRGASGHGRHKRCGPQASYMLHHPSVAAGVAAMQRSLLRAC